jgi:hypothetical protein
LHVVVGQVFKASLIDPPGDVVHALGLGARVEVPVARGIVSAWKAGVLVGSVWTVELEAPPAGGDYQLVWMTPDSPPSYQAMVPLFASNEIPPEASNPAALILSTGG